MTVAVVVDSAAALPADLAAERGISVVPIHVQVGDHDYRDGEISLDELLRRLDDGVSTSGPSPGEFVTAMEAALSGGAEAVLVITVAAEMSMTHQAALMAATMVDGAVEVLDSGTAAGGQALVALAAAATASAGAGLHAVASRARHVAGRVRLQATVDSLDRLVASGRVPHVAGWAGRQLGVNPLFEFAAGRVRRLRPALSRDAALARIVQACNKSRPANVTRLHAAVLHVNGRASVQSLRSQLPGDVERSVFDGPFSPAMVAHTGPGLAGLAWWWETPDDSCAGD